MWVGGQADAVVRLAGALADGWNGWGSSPENFRAEGQAAAPRRRAAPGARSEATWAGIVVVGEDEAEAKALADEREAKGIDALGFHGSPEGFARVPGATWPRRAPTWAIVVLAGPGDRRDAGRGADDPRASRLRR